MRFLICVSILVALVCIPALAADLTGTWKLSVDLESGDHGDPVFVFQQANGKLTGTYNGPFGEQKVTGTVHGETARFEVTASGDAGKVTLTYVAKIEGPDKMTGTMTRDISGSSTPGKWTATRKK
jgi:hypothetical protein